MDYPIDTSLPCLYENNCADISPTCKKICRLYLEMTCLLTNCGMKHAERYIKQLVPSVDDQDAFTSLSVVKSIIVDFVNQGRNLFIHSPYVQTGKTSWALKLMYTYFHYVWNGNGFRPRGYFLHMPEFILNMKSYDYRQTSEYKTIMKRLETVDIAILDDLILTELTSQEQLLVNTILSKRMMDAKSTIVTGLYLTEQNLVNIVGETTAKKLSTFDHVCLVGDNLQKQREQQENKKQPSDKKEGEQC